MQSISTIALPMKLSIKEIVMQVNVITFDIHDFKNHITESFVIENTPENQEMVFTHSFTRNIKFAQMFSFQYDKEMRMPVEFVYPDTWMYLLNVNPELADLAVAETA
jgi:hypothetical protein